MSITSETNRKDFITNGATTDFDLGSGFQFLINDDSTYQLSIYFQETDGTQEEITSGYSITYDSETRLGTIVFAVAPVAGKLSVIRDVPETQSVEYSDPAFPVEATSIQLDKMTMAMQEFVELMNRTPYAQVITKFDSLVLPEPTDVTDNGKSIVLLYDSVADTFSLALADETIPIPDLPADVGKVIIVDASGNLVFSPLAVSDLQLEAHIADLTNPHVVTTTQLSLENVDNTADADKPISDNTQTALDLKANLALVSNVDNTSDADKPISTDTQTALDLKAAKSNVLELDNTDAFTPDSDYEPATKKYVDNLPASGDMRQTVLSSSLDASGLPNFLSASTGLSVELYASVADPLVFTIAEGYSITSSADSFKGYTSSQLISGLTASDTCYLYLVPNPSGVPTVGGHVLNPPTYSYVAPTSPATDDFWFSIPAMKMYQYSGSAWVENPVVFIGEAVTDATTVTSVVNYALRGQYESVQTAIPAVGNATSFAHNIGVLPREFSAKIICKTSNDNYSVGEEVQPFATANGSSNATNPASATKLTGTAILGANGSGLQYSDKSTGLLVAITTASYKWIFRANRGW